MTPTASKDRAILGEDLEQAANRATQSPVLVAVAAHGLQGAPAIPDSGTFDDGTWDRIVREAEFERITGLVVSAVTDDALVITAAQEAKLWLAHRSAMARDLHVERTLLSVVESLTARGIDYLALKGTAVAHLDYADPGLRSFVDADVLVRSEQWDAAVAALRAAGAERAFPEPRPGWERRFTKCTTLRTTTGYEVDLHRTLAFGRFGLTVDLGDLWSDTAIFTLGGNEVRALGLESRWLQACFSAAVGDVPPRLAPLRDVVQLCGDGRLDATRVAEFTARWGAAAVVRRAVNLATGILGVALDPAIDRWARALPVTRAETVALRAYASTGDRYLLLAVSALRAVPGVRMKLAYAGALVWPDRQFVAPRYSGHLDRWRSAAAHLVAGRATARSAGLRRPPSGRA